MTTLSDLPPVIVWTFFLGVVFILGYTVVIAYMSQRSEPSGREWFAPPRSFYEPKPPIDERDYVYTSFYTKIDENDIDGEVITEAEWKQSDGKNLQGPPRLIRREDGSVYRLTETRVLPKNGVIELPTAAAEDLPVTMLYEVSNATTLHNDSD